MTDNPYDLKVLFRPRALLRLGLIGAIVLAVIVLFAGSAGWLSPHRLTQTRMIDTFEAANGPHPGFRRNHAKGVCLEGYFDSNGKAMPLSKALVFRAGRAPVSGRFALAGGMPRTADNPATVRSMALNFALPDGEVWRTGMNDIPVFPVRDARGFYDQLVASKPDPKTGKPDPAAVKGFLAAHPETRAAMARIKAAPFSSGFANARYNGLDAFLLVAADGTRAPVRWAMVPEDAFAPVEKAHVADRNFLFDALAARLARGPARWHLILTLGEAGDPTNDATLPWPADRKTVDAGILTVTALQSEASGNCRDVNFDPLVLPSGLAPSDDPLLSARSAAYAVSFTRRAGETKSPSAVRIGG